MEPELHRNTHEPIHSGIDYHQSLEATDPAIVNTPGHIDQRLEYYRDYVLRQALESDEWTYTPVTADLLVKWLLPNPVWKAETGSYFPKTKETIFKALMTTLTELQDTVTGAGTDGAKQVKVANRATKESIAFRGLSIAIEYPEGSFRKGTAPDGTKWEREVFHPYGYIKKTEGADGDSIDCYVGPDETSDLVFLVNQFKADGSFDEHKVLLGFNTPHEALQGYLLHMPDDWTGFGPLRCFTLPEFQHWLVTGDATKTAYVYMAHRTAGHYDPSTNKPGRLLSEDPKLKGQKVTIFRAVPSTVSTINPKDYVCTVPRFAEEHAVTTAVYEEEPQAVLRTRVPSELLAEAYNPGEYFYLGTEPIHGRKIFEYDPALNKSSRFAKLAPMVRMNLTMAHKTAASMHECVWIEPDGRVHRVENTGREDDHGTWAASYYGLDSEAEDATDQAQEALKKEGWLRLGAYDEVVYLDSWKPLSQVHLEAAQKFLQESQHWMAGCDTVMVEGGANCVNIPPKEFMALNKATEVQRYKTASTGQTEGQAFKAWFKDSKVVDPGGQPLVVYHGTAHDFEAFDMDKQNSNYGNSSRFEGRKGFFFTSSPAEAEDVASWSAAYKRPVTPGERGLQGEHLKPVYLAIQNPYIRKSGGEWTQLWYDRNWEDLQAHIEAKGHDGLIIIGTGKAAGHSMYVAFSPAQIKSATGNNGSFDPNDHRITASESDDIGSGEHAATTDKSGQFWGDAGAGVIFYAQDTGRCLFSFRSEFVNEPHCWGVWGGAVDGHEAPQQAALREAREETGYRGPIHLKEAFVFTKEDFKYTTFLAIVPKEFVPQLDWETEDFQWADMEKPPTPTHFGLKAALPSLQDLLKEITPEQKTAAKIEDGVYSMPLEEAIDEHTKLVSILESADPEGIAAEAKDQGGELKEMLDSRYKKAKTASVWRKAVNGLAVPVIEDFYQIATDAMKDGVQTFDAFLVKLQTGLGSNWPAFLHAAGGYTGLRPIWDAVTEHDIDDLTQSMEEMRVSPRIPSASDTFKGKPREVPLEDPHGEEKLQPDLATMSADPDTLKYNVRLMLNYPEFRGINKKLPAQKQAELIIEHMTDNLVWLYNQWHKEHVERSKSWYVGGNRITHRWAKRFDCPPQAVAGVLASLSPQQHWFQNVTLAERVLSALSEHADEPWNANMTKVLLSRPWGKGEKGATDEPEEDDSDELDPESTVRAKPVDLLPVLKGKTLQDLEAIGGAQGTYLQALWIRAYDEAHNPNACRNVSPEGEFGDWYKKADGSPVLNRWNSFNEVMKAIRVYKDPSVRNISDNIGANHKVRSFYNNLIAPLSSGGDVTIDTHAVAAALVRPLSAASVPVAHNFGSGKAAKKAIKAKPAYVDKNGKKHKAVQAQPAVKAVPGPSGSNITGITGLYGFYAEAYRRAAKQVGIQPREMQSITWEAVRGLFKPAQKRDKAFVANADTQWENYSNGITDKQTTRDSLVQLAGGIEEPSWALPNPGNSAGERHSSYSGQLPSPIEPGGGSKKTTRPRGGAGTSPRAAAWVGARGGVAKLFRRKANAWRGKKVWGSPEGEVISCLEKAGDPGMDYHCVAAAKILKEREGLDFENILDAEPALLAKGWVRGYAADAGYLQAYTWGTRQFHVAQKIMLGVHGTIWVEQGTLASAVLPAEDFCAMGNVNELLHLFRAKLTAKKAGAYDTEFWIHPNGTMEVVGEGHQQWAADYLGHDAPNAEDGVDHSGELKSLGWARVAIGSSEISFNGEHITQAHLEALQRYLGDHMPPGHIDVWYEEGHRYGALPLPEFLAVNRVAELWRSRTARLFQRKARLFQKPMVRA